MLFSSEIVAVLQPGVLLVCDNATSHKSELADFISYIKSQPMFTKSLVPVGKGEFIAHKNNV